MTANQSSRVNKPHLKAFTNNELATEARRFGFRVPTKGRRKTLNRERMIDILNDCYDSNQIQHTDSTPLRESSQPTQHQDKALVEAAEMQNQAVNKELDGVEFEREEKAEEEEDHVKWINEMKATVDKSLEDALTKNTMRQYHKYV